MALIGRAALVLGCVSFMLGLAYLLALAGSPQQVWLFRDVLGLL
ncbi:hypothetical protein [Methylobacillus flagellatus]|nr:hypothetical protein [Methylobacillus flagellatus]